MSVSPGARIKYLRQLTNMSQEELGKRVGVQRAAINKYEKGTVENIPIKTIEKIATVFDVSPTYIVGWNNSDSNQLSFEVRTLQGVKHFYGEDAVDLLEIFSHLNHKGKQRAIQYAEDMLLIYEDEDEHITL